MNRSEIIRSIVLSVLLALPAGYLVSTAATSFASAFVTIAIAMFIGCGALAIWNRKAPKMRKPKLGSGRETGTVKWFNAKKGFGFIIRDANQEEIFVHFRGIRDQGRRRRILRDGQKVEFIVTEGRKGPQADDVTIES